MSEVDTPPHSGAVPGWAKLLIGLVAVLIVVAGVAVYYSLDDDQAPQSQQTPSPASNVSSAPTSPSAETTTSSPPPATAAPAGVASGCIVGPDNSTEALLLAQQEAPHTTEGATDLAGQILKWINQFPRPSSVQVEQALESLGASSADESVTTLAAQLSELRTDVPSFSTSLDEGGYAVLEEQSDLVRVSVYGAAERYENDPEAGAAAATYTLIWEDDMWRILSSSAGAQSYEQMAATGTPFTGGC